MNRPARDYVIRGGVEGLERLKLLSRVMHPSTHALLDRVGVSPAMACLDIGCGGGDIAFDLARRVGPRGKVVGTDIDATKLDLARRRAAEGKMENVEFRLSDVAEGLAAAEFDLVYARFLLTHLKDRAGAVSSMVGAARPGGSVVVEDIDFAGHFCYPSVPSFHRYVDLYARVVERRGGDPFIGPKLPVLLREAGLGGISMNVVQPAGMDGEVKLLNPVTMENIADALLDEGLASKDEIAGIVSELYARARDPGTVMSVARIVQAWGRRR